MKEMSARVVVSSSCGSGKFPRPIREIARASAAKIGLSSGLRGGRFSGTSVTLHARLHFDAMAQRSVRGGEGHGPGRQVELYVAHPAFAACVRLMCKGKYRKYNKIADKVGVAITAGIFGARLPSAS